MLVEMCSKDEIVAGGKYTLNAKPATEKVKKDKRQVISDSEEEEDEEYKYLAFCSNLYMGSNDGETSSMLL